MNQDEIFRLEHPPESPRLEPFASIFLEVLIPAAAEGGWFEAGETPPGTELERISRRIMAQMEIHIGHAVHPAIWVHALLVCAHYYYWPAADIEDLEEQDLRTSAIDAAFSLIQNLKLYHDLYDLYLRIG